MTASSLWTRKTLIWCVYASHIRCFPNASNAMYFTSGFCLNIFKCFTVCSILNQNIFVMLATHTKIKKIINNIKCSDDLTPLTPFCHPITWQWWHRLFKLDEINSLAPFKLRIDDRHHWDNRAEMEFLAYSSSSVLASLLSTTPWSSNFGNRSMHTLNEMISTRFLFCFVNWPTLQYPPRPIVASHSESKPNYRHQTPIVIFEHKLYLANDYMSIIVFRRLSEPRRLKKSKFLICKRLPFDFVQCGV